MSLHAIQRFKTFACSLTEERLEKGPGVSVPLPLETLELLLWTTIPKPDVEDGSISQKSFRMLTLA